MSAVYVLTHGEWVTECGQWYGFEGEAKRHEKVCWACTFGEDDPSKLSIDINRQESK